MVTAMVVASMIVAIFVIVWVWPQNAGPAPPYDASHPVPAQESGEVEHP